MKRNNEKLKIWILQTGEPLPCDKNQRAMRAINLNNLLIAEKNKTLLISSNFNHSLKNFRIKMPLLSSHIKYKNLILINSIGYAKNISLARLLDHLVLSINLLRFLLFHSHKYFKPDLLFIGYPPIEWAFISIIWAKFKKIKTILDIKDLWPDLFYSSQIGIKKKLIKLACIQYTFMRNYIINNTLYISLPTKYYAYNWLKKIRQKDPKVIVSPLVPQADKLKMENKITKSQILRKYNIKKDFDGITIIFFGSLMRTAYDFDNVLKSINIFNKSKVKLRLIICGDGPIYKEIKNFIFMNNMTSYIFLTGWVNRDEMIYLSKYADYAIAPYKDIDNYLGHLPNKISDYLQLGLPVISTLKLSFEDLIQEFEIGFSYGNQESLLKVLGRIESLNFESLISMKLRCKKLWKKKFDSEIVYRNLIKDLKQIVYRDS